VNKDFQNCLYSKIDYRGGKVLQGWRISNGNVRLSHLLSSFLSQNLHTWSMCHYAKTVGTSFWNFNF